MLLDLVRSGYGVVALGYSGTRHGTLYPESDLEAASDQTRRYVGFLRKRLGPSGSVTIIGVSAGSYVAYLATRGMPEVRTILLSPVIASPASLVAQAKRTPRGSQGYSQPVVLRRRAVGSRFDKPLPHVRTTEEERTAAFFGRFYDLPLADLIRQMPTALHNSVSVLVGAKDDRIGLADLPAFKKRHPAIEVKIIDWLQHGPQSDAEAEKLSDEIVQLIERR